MAQTIRELNPFDLDDALSALRSGDSRPGVFRRLAMKEHKWRKLIALLRRQGLLALRDVGSGDLFVRARKAE